MNTIAELYRLAVSCPTTSACLQAWQKGLYPSFEAMLIDLACTLCHKHAVAEARLSEGSKKRDGEQ